MGPISPEEYFLASIDVTNVEHPSNMGLVVAIETDYVDR